MLDEGPQRSKNQPFKKHRGRRKLNELRNSVIAVRALKINNVRLIAGTLLQIRRRASTPKLCVNTSLLVPGTVLMNKIKLANNELGGSHV